MYGTTCWKTYHKLQPKSKIIDELKVALHTIWEELPQEHINEMVVNFTKCLTQLTVCVAASGSSIRSN